MKHNIKIAALILLLLSPSFAYSKKVTFFLGTSTLYRDGKQTTIQGGEIVAIGDIIKTSNDGFVEILYDNGTKVAIKKNSEVKIGDKNINNDKNITLASGGISAKFAKASKGESKIITPTAICAVRGTDFDVAVSKGGDTKVELSNGKLNVRNSYGSVDLDGGFSAETDLAGRPIKGRSDNIDDWENNKNNSLDKDINARIKKYEAHVNNFSERSESDNKELGSLRNATINASSKKEFKDSGEKIVKMESEIEEAMLMNAASKSSIENLMNDYAGKKADISNKFKDLADKCNTVHEQQLKNYQAIQNIKDEYKKAYEEIMNKYKEERTRIYKNLDDVRKR
jgi:hypothetical protein